MLPEYLPKVKTELFTGRFRPPDAVVSLPTQRLNDSAVYPPPLLPLIFSAAIKRRGFRSNIILETKQDN
ncbi:MAG: hypothetical protein HYY50_05095 [Candidatus Kerfeldbacteria bacterium]|nr:hypothetical protein [Candidatus Kerfeldbacteria bacterium]